MRFVSYGRGVYLTLSQPLTAPFAVVHRPHYRKLSPAVEYFSLGTQQLTCFIERSVVRWVISQMVAPTLQLKLGWMDISQSDEMEKLILY